MRGGQRNAGTGWFSKRFLKVFVGDPGIPDRIADSECHIGGHVAAVGCRTQAQPAANCSTSAERDRMLDRCRGGIAARRVPVDERC
jgi:hypothetical protein